MSDTEPATLVLLPLLVPPLDVVEVPSVMVAPMPELSIAVTETPPHRLDVRVRMTEE